MVDDPGVAVHVRQDLRRVLEGKGLSVPEAMGGVLAGCHVPEPTLEYTDMWGRVSQSQHGGGAKCRAATVSCVGSNQVGRCDRISKVAHLLGDDREREAVLGVVHEFAHPPLGVAVA